MRSTASRWLPFQSRLSKRRGARRVIARNSALYSTNAPAMRRAASEATSVKVCRQLRVQLMLIQALDLRGQYASSGELGERVQRKELHAVGLAAERGGASGALAEKEQLVDMVDAGRMRVAALVDERRQLHRPRFVTRLLADLACHGPRGGVVDIDPASGQGPLAIGAFPDEEHAAFLEYAAAYVDLRCRVAFLTLPESLGLREGDVELGGEHGRDQLRELAEALPVERVVGEGEPVLGDRLHLAGPIEEGRLIHMFRMSASPKADVATSVAPSIS